MMLPRVDDHHRTKNLDKYLSNNRNRSIHRTVFFDTPRFFHKEFASGFKSPIQQIIQKKNKNSKNDPYSRYPLELVGRCVMCK